jgi:hypothetical protein
MLDHARMRAQVGRSLGIVPDHSVVEMSHGKESSTVLTAVAGRNG